MNMETNDLNESEFRTIIASEVNTSRQGSREAESWQCTIFRFALYAIFMGVMCLVGFIFNTLSLIVLRGERHTPIASFLLRCIAIADNCFILAWTIQYPVNDARKFFNIRITERHYVWYVLLVYTYPTLYVTQLTMIWLTVLVALNRFVAICLPYRSTTLCSVFNVRVAVAAIVASSALYNVPRFCERTVTLSAARGAKVEATGLETSALYKTVYVDVLYYVISFFLPLAILAFCNSFVIVKYRLMLRRRRQLISRNKRDVSKEHENNVTVVMIMVVLVFMMCQLPARLVQIVWSYSYDHCHQFHYYLIHVSNTLEVLNSSLNFVVYCLFHHQFRITLKRKLCYIHAASPSRNCSTRGECGEGEGTSSIQGPRCSRRIQTMGIRRTLSLTAVKSLGSEKWDDSCVTVIVLPIETRVCRSNDDTTTGTVIPLIAFNGATNNCV